MCGEPARKYCQSFVYPIQLKEATDETVCICTQQCCIVLKCNITTGENLETDCLTIKGKYVITVPHANCPYFGF